MRDSNLVPSESTFTKKKPDNVITFFKEPTLKKFEYNTNVDYAGTKETSSLICMCNRRKYKYEEN